MTLWEFNQMIENSIPWWVILWPFVMIPIVFLYYWIQSKKEQKEEKQKRCEDKCKLLDSAFNPKIKSKEESKKLKMLKEK